MPLPMAPICRPLELARKKSRWSVGVFWWNDASSRVRFEVRSSAMRSRRLKLKQEWRSKKCAIPEISTTRASRTVPDVYTHIMRTYLDSDWLGGGRLQAKRRGPDPGRACERGGTGRGDCLRHRRRSTRAGSILLHTLRTPLHRRTNQGHAH